MKILLILGLRDFEIWLPRLTNPEINKFRNQQSDSIFDFEMAGYWDLVAAFNKSRNQ